MKGTDWRRDGLPHAVSCSTDPAGLSGSIPDVKQATPLLAAVLKSDTQATKKLLEEGADPNEGRWFGMSALMLAIINSNQPAVPALLDRGADPRATDRNGSTTLMWAVGSESSDPSLVQELLKRGVDRNGQNKLGESALTWASRRGSVSLVERLKPGSIGCECNPPIG